MGGEPQPTFDRWPLTVDSPGRWGKRAASSGDGEVAPGVPKQDGDPIQSRQQFVRGAEEEVGHHLEVFQVEVRLAKAVEENQSVGAGAGSGEIILRGPA